MCLPLSKCNNNIISILKQFNTVALSEIEHLKLMDRVEQKFVFALPQLESLLPKLSEKYRLLEVNNSLIHPYYTVYFDTSDFDMYNKHHNGKATRYKIRHRFYNNTNASFLEVKFKNNKSRVLKKRIETQTEFTTIPLKYSDFIFQNSEYTATLLQKTLDVSFNRITLAGNESRFTIDFGLSFCSDSKVFNNKGLVIGEFKSLEGNADKTITKELKKLHIYPTQISKYCMGIAQLNPSFKTNMFKQKVKLINKLNYA